MRVLVSVVNFMNLMGLIIANFNRFCRKLMIKRNNLLPFRNPIAESWDSVYTFLDLRLKVQIFMNEESKIVVELDDKSVLGFSIYKWYRPVIQCHKSLNFKVNRN
jgi:hypothetical protein